MSSARQKENGNKTHTTDKNKDNGWSINQNVIQFCHTTARSTKSLSDGPRVVLCHGKQGDVEGNRGDHIGTPHHARRYLLCMEPKFMPPRLVPVGLVCIVRLRTMEARCKHCCGHAPHNYVPATARNLHYINRSKSHQATRPHVGTHLQHSFKV